MARTKGMLNLSGNIEVNAQAPLDARTIVPTEADLTVASNFPYPYVGLEVYVTGTNKKFRLVNLDTTQSSSWYEIGEGGGGGETYSDFTGATASTAGAHGLVPAPSAGDEGKVLFGNGAWGALPSVDLSVLSNEANILSTTEKVVGQHTDGKLLYQKVVSVPSTSTVWGVIHTETNADYLNVIWARYYFNAYGTEWLKMNLANANDVLVVATTGANILMNGRGYTFGNNNPVQMLIQYTKTTDSPLPSDVKFAGVTSDGKALYKQTISTTFANGLIYTITDTNIVPYRLQANMRADSKSVMSDGFIYNTNNYWSIWVDNLKIYGVNGGTSYAGRTVDIDLYYTLAS